MRLLVVGEGGREHALVWKAAQSPQVARVYTAPGNTGTACEPHSKNVPIAVDDIAGLVQFAQQQNIDLCIIGPEVPLVLGLTDALNAAGVACFGPSKAAAQLEGSKAFTKDFLQRHGIPTARYGSFTDVDKAKAYVQKMGAPIVIKADGLAAGKGVIIAQDEAQAFASLDDILLNQQFGQAGASVVIEEFLEGEEASFICMADGQTVQALATSQDHKAAYDGDLWPNTGGMGAVSPAPVVDAAMHDKIMEQIIMPTIVGLAAEGMPYTGFLYAGVMIDAEGQPKVLEYNCRMGDPETQPIMLRLQSDMVQHCMAATRGELADEKIKWHDQAAVGVVLAAEGYPAAYDKGVPITGLNQSLPDGHHVFHAGVSEIDGQLVTNGGRVLCVCALGDRIEQAQQRAYAVADTIDWPGKWLRRDIAHRAIKAEQSANNQRTDK